MSEVDLSPSAAIPAHAEPLIGNVLEDFLRRTEPAQVTTDFMRDLVRNHDPRSAALMLRLPQQHPAV